jgi:hypothetical protein
MHIMLITALRSALSLIEASQVQSPVNAAIAKSNQAAARLPALNTATTRHVGRLPLLVPTATSQYTLRTLSKMHREHSVLPSTWKVLCTTQNGRYTVTAAGMGPSPLCQELSEHSGPVRFVPAAKLAGVSSSTAPAGREHMHAACLDNSVVAIIEGCLLLTQVGTSKACWRAGQSQRLDQAQSAL